MTTFYFMLAAGVLFLTYIAIDNLTNYNEKNIEYLKRLWRLYWHIRFNLNFGEVVAYSNFFKKYDRARKIHKYDGKWVCYYVDLYRDDHMEEMPDYRDYKYCTSCFMKPTRSLVRLLWWMYRYDQNMRQIFLVHEGYETISSDQLKGLLKLMDPNEYYQKKRVV